MRRKNELKANNNKKVCQLTNWTIVLLREGDVAIQGLHWPKSNGSTWQSTAVTSRTTNKTLETTNRIYKLKGQLNKQLALSKGIPPKIIDAFCDGFPTNWNVLIKNFWNVYTTTKIDPKDYDPSQHTQNDQNYKPLNTKETKKKIQKQNTQNKKCEVDVLVTSFLSNSRSLSIYCPPETQSKKNVTRKNMKQPAAESALKVKSNLNIITEQENVKKNINSENQTPSVKDDIFLKPKDPVSKKLNGKGKMTTSESMNLKENVSSKMQLRNRKPAKDNTVQSINEEKVQKEIEKKESSRVKKQNKKPTTVSNVQSTVSREQKIENVADKKQNTDCVQAYPKRRVLRNRTQMPNYCELNDKEFNKRIRVQSSNKIINNNQNSERTQEKAKEIKSKENEKATKNVRGKKLKTNKTKDVNTITDPQNIIIENNLSNKSAENHKKEIKSSKLTKTKTAVKKTNKCDENNIQNECNNEEQTDKPLEKLTAKKGTKKRKQQLINLMEQINEGYEDDLFESTPFKKQCNILSDDFLEININENQHIQTPVLMKPICEPVSARKTPTFNTGISPGTLLAQRGDAKIVWKKSGKSLKAKNDKEKEVKKKPRSLKPQKDIKNIFATEKQESGGESDDDDYFSEED
ncbi:nucleoporin GLE1-like isoform X2 [Centruroides sculpturatus]|uniref:nucleoporin GLE1-like isoform X1 n=1 Tax=Centruroides sculpturatus TaxID=218467 RepID=UPI000C6DFF31|nr:nucleoporin GLE1-like isoform X1 [Centruroides sculpturatus]XP_023232980.1 nucleoporin GLE1-like isoform X2 [Centruroides sculpturatus]